MIKKIIITIILSLAFVLIKVPCETNATTLSADVSSTNAVVEIKQYFDVPLENELQDYIIDLCKVYNISPTLVFAVIEQESCYDPNALNRSEDCFGLMQINECNFITYNLDEPYNAFENVRVGITMLSELLSKYEDVHKALMAYNCGEYGAKCLWNKGITSNTYSRSVLNKQEKINESERVYYYVEEN
ncbi:MAG: transglycosylase SLT domain-containing protein [Clostridia bacterium]|nr:transglycosylase SLT domain-containing protein [Clostridia bacterium]